MDTNNEIHNVDETNINKVDFDENKPYLAPHNPFTLEGHWQPWYDDRRDYNTNAPSYYDYLANFNQLIKSIVDFVNELAKRDVKTEDTKTIELIKKTSWIVDGVNDIVLQANAKISQVAGNKIIVKDDGLYVAADDLEALKAKVDTLQQNFNNHINDFNALKTRVDLLDGGGWATKEQLEELRRIIEANREDYENADSGLRLLIANMQKRLDALDGLSVEMDTWNEKVNKLNAETLNVKNIATLAATLAGALSVNSYYAVPVTLLPVIDKNNGFKTQYNSYTQRINGRTTRIERFGFDFEGITSNGQTENGSGLDPKGWTKIATVSVSDIEANYKGTISNNLKYQVYAYSYRYYQNYFQDYTDGIIHPWEIRLMYDKASATFVLFARGLKQLATVGEIFHSTREELYSIVTWLDDEGNEYLPSYQENGEAKPLAQCDRVPDQSTWQ